VRAVMQETLETYRPRDDDERADVERLSMALRTTDVCSRSTPLHVTGSALVVHPPTQRVLLRWHPRMEMWMQVGGHFDAGETDPRRVALREAHEETGLSDLHALTGGDGDEPVQIVIVPVPASHDEPAHEHADFRYIFVTDLPDAIVEESADAKLRWTLLAEAIDTAAQPNLREFLTRVAEAITAGDPSRGASA
jgi:8-oxo-dGTP pyrophosphatase MutT (NUDIX family)